MATSLISTFNRKFLISAATRRYGSPHRLGNGSFGATLSTDSKLPKLRKASSDTNINLLGRSNISDRENQQTRFFGTGYKHKIFGR
jgi:hypothetical protein